MTVETLDELRGLAIRVERARLDVSQVELADRLSKRERRKRSRWAWTVIIMRVEMEVLELSQAEYRRWLGIIREIAAEKDEAERAQVEAN